MAGDCEPNIVNGEAWRHDRLRFENSQLRADMRRAEEVSQRLIALAREADHRIKNSLHIAGSMMRLQAAREQSPEARRALETASSRVMSIGFIHDALQPSGGEDAIDLGATLETLCRSLHVIGCDPHRIAIEVDAMGFQAPTSFARPVLLMVNELVINALRHAFPAGRTGTIRASAVRADGEFCLMVTDDGVGLPADYAGGQGYGLGLVRMMCRQIGGVLTFESVRGARAILLAPAPAG